MKKSKLDMSSVQLDGSHNVTGIVYLTVTDFAVDADYSSGEALGILMVFTLPKVL